jgi:recombination protein RecA
MFGKKTTRSGGRALDFYASLIVWLHHRETLKRTIKGVERPIGIKVKAKVEKNKISLPMREVEFDFIFGLGIDNLISNAEWLKDVKRLNAIGLVPKEGAKSVNEQLVEWLKEVNKKPNEEYWNEVTKLNSIVRQVWREIETDFLPQRRKYNNQ